MFSSSSFLSLAPNPHQTILKRGVEILRGTLTEPLSPLPDSRQDHVRNRDREKVEWPLSLEQKYSGRDEVFLGSSRGGKQNVQSGGQEEEIRYRAFCW